MKTLKNGCFYENNAWIKKDIVIHDECIVAIGLDLNEGEIVNCEGLHLLPSFMDPHVHFRQPGFEHKETIYSGSKAAAAGGYTTVFAMPNLSPVPDNETSIQAISACIKQDACIEVIQLSAITKGQKGKGELVDFASIAPYTVGFSDDGKGIMKTKDMYETMLHVAAVKRTVFAHCEDEDLLYGGYIRKGIYSEKMKHLGILGITETVQLARDLVLALETKAHLHVCHVSTKQSVDLIRFYKTLGCHVTCEVSPHHLVLSEMDLTEDGNYKMNPPLGSIHDQLALIEGLLDGTIDCIATDHAPHAKNEKQTLEKAAFGIVGLETAFPLLYTHLVKTNKVSLQHLSALMSQNVASLFHLEKNEIKVGFKANLTAVDLRHAYTIDSSTFHSKSTNQPFEGMEVYGKIMKTIYKGVFVYEG
jgi:dihydroorotase